MKVPISNLYYLLCYAWDCLEQADMVNVDQADLKSMSNLLGRILSAATAHLRKRGLDRQYLTEEVETASPRGKIDVATTLKRNSQLRSRVHCIVDNLSHDILHNQILKTTMLRLIRCNDLDRSIHDELVRSLHDFREISTIPITSGLFSQVTLHRNNAHYRLPLEVCRLIHEQRLIEEQGKQAKFRDFLRDDRPMAALFEKFVLNFYRREQTEFRAKSEILNWQDVVATQADLSFLPRMRTDISLDSPTRKVIIDTKYYSKALTSYHGSASIHTENLYQLFAYLKNFEAQQHEQRPLTGILLYPVVGDHFDLKYQIQGHLVRVVTLNLDQPWQAIHNDLIRLIDLSEMNTGSVATS